MAILQRGLTLEEFLKLPEEEPALEFLHGMVTQKVSPKGPHSGLQSELVVRFDRVARPHKLARVFSELRTTFGGLSLVPDISVYRRARVPQDPNGRVAEDFFLPPDIAVEISSPGQSLGELSDRCRWYVEHGVQITLLVNPRDESITSFRAGAPAVVLRGADRIDLDPVLPNFEFTVQELFDSLSLD